MKSLLEGRRQASGGDFAVELRRTGGVVTLTLI